MTTVNHNLSFDSQAVELVQARAKEVGKPVNPRLVDPVEEAQNARNHLAAEGYCALATEAIAFAEASFPIALNIWPVWCETGEAKSG